MRDLKYALVIGMATVLMLVAWAEDALAQSCEFIRVADTNTPIPGGTGNFLTFGDPSLDGGNVAFLGGVAGAFQGIYTGVSGSLVRVADANTPVPDGTGTFPASFGDPSLDGGKVAFVGGLAGLFQGIYTDVGGSLVGVADVNTPIPGGTGNFQMFGDPSLDGGNVAFVGERLAEVFQGIYTDVGGSLVRVADGNTPIPGGTGNFQRFGDPSLDGGNVAFVGRVGGPPQGIYTDVGGSLVRVADVNTPIPGGTGNFLTFGDPSLDGGNVAFVGGGGLLNSSRGFTRISEEHWQRLSIRPTPWTGRRSRPWKSEEKG